MFHETLTGTLFFCNVFVIGNVKMFATSATAGGAWGSSYYRYQYGGVTLILKLFIVNRFLCLLASNITVFLARTNSTVACGLFEKTARFAAKSICICIGSSIMINKNTVETNKYSSNRRLV